jgi:hypothetical protein
LVLVEPRVFKAQTTVQRLMVRILFSHQLLQQVAVAVLVTATHQHKTLVVMVVQAVVEPT